MSCKETLQPLSCIKTIHTRLGIDTTHLLQQDSVVTLKGLKDVMVTAQGSKAIHSCIAMATTALAADGQRLRCVLCCVRLQACKDPEIYTCQLKDAQAKSPDVICRATSPQQKLGTVAA